MKRLSVFLFIILSCKLLASQPDAVYLKIEKTFIQHHDGTIEQHYVHDLKIYSYFAIHRKYGETLILYNPRFQQVKINDVFTLLENGTKVKLPENAVNEVLPNEAIDAPAYNHLRKLVITHTGLEPNCIIHVDYSVISRKEFFPCLMGNERLLQSSPVGEFIVKVIIPQQTELKYDLLNSDIQPEISKIDEYNSFTWKFEKLDAITEEPAQAAPQLYEPFLIFTTRDMKVVYNEFLNQPALNFFVSETPREWIEKLKSDCKNELELINKVHQYIVNYIRTYPIPYHLTGYKLQTADEVFQNCGGTKLEKLCLMSALLQSVGIKVIVKLIAPGISFPVNALNIDAFTEVMISVYIKTEKTQLEQNYFADLKDEISVNENYHRVVYCTILPLFTGMSTFDPEAFKDILKIDVQKNILYSIDSQGNIYSNSAPAKLIATPVLDTIFTIIRIPWSDNGIENWHHYPVAMSRQSPIILPLTKTDYRKIIFKLPGNHYYLGKSLNFSKGNTVGDFSYSIQQKGKKIIVERKINFNMSIVNPSDYEKLKELISFWQSENFNTIILKSK